MLVNREGILAKVEPLGTYNTDPTPVAGTDDVLIENPAWSPEGLNMIDRPTVRASIGTVKHIYAGMMKTISFDVELKGSGTAGTPPEVGPLLRACGLGETIVASTSVTYAPVSTGHESCTIYYFQDGKRHVLTGCRGNATLNLQAGSYGKWTFTMMGHSGASTDVSFPTLTYDSTVPVPLTGLSFSIDSYSAIVNTLSLDLGNDIQTPSSLAQSDGYGESRIIERDVKGTLDPEEVLVATYDFESKLRSGATFSMTTGAIGSTGGNIVTVTCPAVSYRNIGPGSREGIRTAELEIGCAESSGDDEISIAFT